MPLAIYCDCTAGLCLIWSETLRTGVRLGKVSRAKIVTENGQLSRVMKKTNNLHMRKTKTQISFAVTAKLISAFVFATWIVQYLYFLNTKFQASSHLQ